MVLLDLLFTEKTSSFILGGFNDYGEDDTGFYPSDPDLGSTTTDPKDEDGNFVVGDMILSPEQYAYQFGPANGDGDDGPLNAGRPNPRFRWEGGLVPYEFQRGLSELC